jgi:putative restriction endonuclease
MNELLAFDLWLGESSLASSTQRDYYRAIEGRISDWAREAGIIEDSVLDITDADDFDTVRTRIEKLEIYQERNSKENNRFSAALSKFSDYLHDATLEYPLKQVALIRSRTDIPETQKKALINARLGQGKFRRDLLLRWGSCALLGVNDPLLLVASHIKPWSVSTDGERLDSYNGLLLTAHVDRAFDKGRISFDLDGRILISPKFLDAALLGINREMVIQIDPEHRPYLDYHRESVFAAV